MRTTHNALRDGNLAFLEIYLAAKATSQCFNLLQIPRTLPWAATVEPDANSVTSSPKAPLWWPWICYSGWIVLMCNRC